MKTRVLLLIAMISFLSVSATSTTKLISENGFSNRYNDAVTFTERGIKFHVFLNGDFDFNTRRHYNGVHIERDYDGKIRRVGNVFVNYDFYGNVNRIGNVFMEYNRGYLSRVGNMNINYDRWGRPHFRGFVKGGRTYYGSACPTSNVNVHVDVYDYDDAFFYRNDFRRNYHRFKEDNNFYYYRATKNARIGSRNKVLKRRKNTREKRYSKSDTYHNSPVRKSTVPRRGNSRR